MVTSPPKPSRRTPSRTVDINWFEQWYPVASTRMLNKGTPNPLRLMEINLVAWPSADGWRVAQDRCPHRGAPLSYGRLEQNSTLTCSYHGWQFASDGATAYVPTFEKQKCGACLRVHPSRVCKHGLLWVWPQAAAPGSAAEEFAFSKPLPIDHLPDESGRVTDWTVNRVPIPWASLLENTLDDAHGVHAHHGLAGLDRALARPAYGTRSGEAGGGDEFVAWVNISGPLVASEVSGSVDADSTDAGWVNSCASRETHTESRIAPRPLKGQRPRPVCGRQVRGAAPHDRALRAGVPRRGLHCARRV